MPPRKAALFRAIKASGDIGASSVELLNAVYDDGHRPRSETVKVHVGQINSLLEETDFRIVSIDRRWILRKRRVS
jgi:hypothetical protein